MASPDGITRISCPGCGSMMREDMTCTNNECPNGMSAAELEEVRPICETCYGAGYLSSDDEDNPKECPECDGTGLQ